MSHHSIIKSLSEQADGKSIILAAQICINKSYSVDEDTITGISYIILNCKNEKMVLHAKKAYAHYMRKTHWCSLT